MRGLEVVIVRDFNDIIAIIIFRYIMCRGYSHNSYGQLRDDITHFFRGFGHWLRSENTICECSDKNSHSAGTSTMLALCGMGVVHSCQK